VSGRVRLDPAGLVSETAGAADQPAGFFAVDGLLIGEPAVQIGLLAAAQGAVVCVEPVQERDGAAGQPADHAGLHPTESVRSRTLEDVHHGTRLAGELPGTLS